MEHSLRDEVARWAASAGVEVAWPESFLLAPERSDREALLAERTAELDIRTNPCIDFGRVEERIPACVLRPGDVDGLAACLRFLRAHRLPYKVRGGGHSAGGQVLGDGIPIVDLRRLDRILADRPEREEIEVEGGAWWLALVEQLQPQGRRPAVLTDNLRSTVAGTLAVGGFGDTSHVSGLQIDQVAALRLVTPDGERHDLRPGDELFDLALAGRGQLGVIAAATIRTVRRTHRLAARVLRWPTLYDFLRDAAAVAAYRLYEFFRARIQWSADGSTLSPWAIAANFADLLPTEDRALRLIRPTGGTAVEQLDLLELARRDPAEKWQFSCPAVELVFPLPDGLDTFLALNQRIVAAGLPRFLPRGSSVMVVPRSRLPLAPTPPAPFGLMLALRPESSFAEARALLPLLRDLGREATAAGAHLYMMSVEPEDRSFLARQWGGALDRVRRLKAALDPDDLCNPGLLPPG